MVRRGDANRINVLAADDLAEIIVRRAVAVPIGFIHLPLRVVAPGRVHVADGQHAGLLRQKSAQQPARLRPHADKTHRKLRAWAGGPNFGRKQEWRCAGSDRGGFKKMSSADLVFSVHDAYISCRRSYGMPRGISLRPALGNEPDISVPHGIAVVLQRKRAFWFR